MNGDLFLSLEEVDLKLQALCGGIECAAVCAEEACGNSRHNTLLNQIRCLRETADSVRASLDEALCIEVQMRTRNKQSESA